MTRCFAVRCLAAVVCIMPALLAGASAMAEESLSYADMRARMVAIVELHAAVSNAELGLPMFDQSVLDAMNKVERHAFVPAELAPLAYLDTPLPVGHDQNIAQPYIVALMTQLADVHPGDKVFETGTGAGYHAAILAELGANVVSVEIVPELAERAASVLNELGYDSVEVHIADGYDGWPEGAPFDVMVIKESVADVPPTLLAQLKPGGRMVVPIGSPEGEQFLTVITRSSDGGFDRRKVLPVRFSPFQGGQRT